MLGVDEWIVLLVQGMYTNAGSDVCVGKGYSQEIEVKVGIQSPAFHQRARGLVM